MFVAIAADVDRGVVFLFLEALFLLDEYQLDRADKLHAAFYVLYLDSGSTTTGRSDDRIARGDRASEQNPSGG
jgi:hypothetical protein